MEAPNTESPVSLLISSEKASPFAVEASSVQVPAAEELRVIDAVLESDDL